MSDLIERHRRACAGFSRVVGRFEPDEWERPTPCTDWDARAVVEHVIGFHDFLLLRPLGARAHRPCTDPAARWEATSRALFDALAVAGALERPTELPGGGQSSPAKMLGALTTDVLVHTWDLARAVDVPAELDAELCTSALDAVRAGDLPRDGGMFRPAVRVAVDADATAQLVALYGRDPEWQSA
jgi:uncharacterized protein (TIGR03086 family)